MTLPGWIYIGIFVHVIIALVFISSLLYYHYKSNTVAVQVMLSMIYYIGTITNDIAYATYIIKSINNGFNFTN